MTPSQEAWDYAAKVESGDIPSCKWIKLACKRFLNDMERGDGRGLKMHEQKAQKAIDFYQRVHQIKGEWAGQPIDLSSWQKFILVNLFGWVWKDSDLRRFRSAYIEVARKNGKSTFVAPLGLYMLHWDGEPGAEVYSAATSRDQARICLLYTSPSPRDRQKSRMPSSA